MNNIEKIVSILVKPIQALENAIQQVRTQMGITNGVGAQLDNIGRIVRQPRGGLADVDYKRYLSARIATNRSTGRREELIKICRLILNDSNAQVHIERRNVASIYLRIENSPVTPTVEAALVGFMRQAVATGVRINVQSNAVAVPLRFKFTGGAVTGPGFDNSVSPGSGGAFADERV